MKIIKEYKDNYILIKVCEYYYFGWLGIDVELKSLEAVRELADTKPFRLRALILKDIEEDTIPLIDTAMERLPITNGWDTFIKVCTSKKTLRKLYNSGGSSSRYYILQSRHCPNSCMYSLVANEGIKVATPLIGAILNNPKTPAKIINMFTPKVLRTYHDSYLRLLIDNVKYKHKYRKKLLKRLSNNKKENK